MLSITPNQRIALVFWWVVCSWINVYLFYGAVNTVIVILG